MKRLINRILARYVVVASFDGRIAHHYARDWDEALSWAGCYMQLGDQTWIYESLLGMHAHFPKAARAIHY